MKRPRLHWRKFGRELKATRSLDGLGLREAARKSKINHSTFARAERGRPVEAAHFIYICRYWGLNPWEYVS
jgi:transcriptional regulator with XRE-family HTH domain